MITAKQKKFWIPLITFVVSITCFIWLLGSFWAMVVAPLMAWSVGVFGYYNYPNIVEDIGNWFNRGGWK